MCEGGGGRMRRRRSPGYRIKNKNPTQSCGELTATWLSLAVKCVKKMSHFKCTALPHRHVCNNMFSPRFSHSPGSRLCLCMHAKTARVHLLAIQPANKIHPASQRKKKTAFKWHVHISDSFCKFTYVCYKSPSPSMPPPPCCRAAIEVLLFHPDVKLFQNSPAASTFNRVPVQIATWTSFNFPQRLPACHPVSSPGVRNLAQPIQSFSCAATNKCLSWAPDIVATLAALQVVPEFAIAANWQYHQSRTCKTNPTRLSLAVKSDKIVPHFNCTAHQNMQNQQAKGSPYT